MANKFQTGIEEGYSAEKTGKHKNLQEYPVICDIRTSEAIFSQV
jgi:hypothetical protein